MGIPAWAFLGLIQFQILASLHDQQLCRQLSSYHLVEFAEVKFRILQRLLSMFIFNHQV